MSSNKTPMNREAAARIQAAEAHKAGGKVQAGGFAARAQAAAARNEPAGHQGSKSGGKK